MDKIVCLSELSYFLIFSFQFIIYLSITIKFCFISFQCDILFLPCGHVCCCWKCENTLTAGCPLCRAEIKQKVKLQTIWIKNEMASSNFKRSKSKRRALKKLNWLTSNFKTCSDLNVSLFCLVSDFI